MNVLVSQIVRRIRACGARRVFAAILVSAAMSPSAQAFIITFDSTNDSGPGSLREAIANASDGDILKFVPTTGDNTIVLQSTLVIDKSLTIDGSSSPNGLILDGNGQVRILRVTGERKIGLQSLTLRNAFPDPSVDAGAVYQQSDGGELFIQDCLIINNRGAGSTQTTLWFVGASNGTSKFTMINTTVDNNSNEVVGGVAVVDAEVFITGCTFSRMFEGTAAGFFLGGALIVRSLNGDFKTTITNSTFSGNRSFNSTAGIQVGASTGNSIDVTLSAVTITENEALASNLNQKRAGGLLFESDVVGVGDGTISVAALSTIVSGNTLVGAPNDVLGTLENTSTFNLIGTGGGLANGVQGNIVGVTNPQLGPLRNNGGPTETHLPLSGSPALDVANVGEGLDQRGFLRPLNGLFDIGSVEGVDNDRLRRMLTSRLNRTLRKFRIAKRQNNERRIIRFRNKVKDLRRQLRQLR